MKKLILMLSVILPLNLVSAQTALPGGHSNLKLECKTCHSCEIPTKENPCLKPCPRESMVTVKFNPGEGPDVITINKFSDKQDIYKPVVFSHRLHSEMSEMTGGCSTCHHYNPPGKIIGCDNCHEKDRQREDLSKPDLKGAFHRQCMNCHREWSHETECLSCHEQNGTKKQAVAKDGSKSAKYVHPKIISPVKVTFETPNAKAGKMVTFFHDEHVNLFGLECGTCHSNETCVKCHDTKKSTQAVKISVEEHHKVCSKCHDTKSSCNLCHQNKPAAGFNHFAKTGFDISKFHSKLNCSRCHTQKSKFGGLNKECSSCHGAWTQENFRHGVTGLELDEIHKELECENCHTDKSYSKPVCESCHDDKSFPKDKPGKLINSKR